MQVDIQHLGSTRCKVHQASIHQCQTAERWPIRAAYVAQFDSSLRQALSASYAAFALYEREAAGKRS